MAVVTPTDCPKSVRNRCVIELFCDVVLLSLCPFDISDGVEAFVIGLTRSVPFCHTKQKRSTEGCSKFKSPETRQVQERLVST